MKSIEAVKILYHWDRQERWLFSSNELGMLFDERGNTLRRTISRLLEQGVIERVARDLYIYAFRHVTRDLIGEIAVYLRPGEFTYESLESAASQWGVISQIPIGRITCVTSGPAGEVKTPFGVFDFEHTEMPLLELLERTADRRPENILPIASKQQTVKDLLDHDRSTELICWEEMEDED